MVNAPVTGALLPKNTVSPLGSAGTLGELSSYRTVPLGLRIWSGTAVLSRVIPGEFAVALRVIVSGGIVAGVVPFACSTMVIEDVPAGTSKVTTSPTL